MPRFNIIGAGQVGSALAYLLCKHTEFKLAGVLSRNIASAEGLCSWLNQGQAVMDYANLPPADLYLITVPDTQIPHCAEKLAASQLLRPSDSVIHCSGVLSSKELSPVQACGAQIASVHPIKSFVDPQLSVNSFAGTFCGIEGDKKACADITAWVTAMGGKAFPIDSEQKLIYHSAFVFASNYLVALTEIAQRCLQQAGIDQANSQEILASLMRPTLEQIVLKGTQTALSGPIARGDAQVVKEELAILSGWEPKIAEVYRLLGQFAAQLAKERGTDPGKIMDIHKILS